MNALTITVFTANMVLNAWAIAMWSGWVIPDIAGAFGRKPNPDTALGVALLIIIHVSRHAYWELRPFYLPALMVRVAWDLAHGRDGITDWLFYVVGVAVWFMPPGDEDDRWRRRRRKAADVIRRHTSGRLVVQPAHH